MSYPTPRVTPEDLRPEVTERLAAYLLEKGYVLCDNTGIALEPDRRHTNVVGLLLPDRTVHQRRRLMGLLRARPRRARMGTIWTKSILRDASPDYWLFEIIGRELFNEALQLRSELQQHFQVRIQTKIVEDELSGEVFPGELDS